MTTSKLIRDGMVAVLYSPGYGAGWSSWAPRELREGMVFYPELAEAVDAWEKSSSDEKLKERAFHPIVEKHFPDVYMGGVDQLSVQWLPVGTAFRIDEYDGSESIVILDRENYFTA